MQFSQALTHACSSCVTAENHPKVKTALCSSCCSLGDDMLTVQSTVHDRCGGVSLKDLKGVYCLSQNILVLAGCSHHSGMAALKTAVPAAQS